MDDDERELRRLVRRERDAVHRLRLDRLRERLRSAGALAVRHNRCGLSGDRSRIELDDGTTLRLWLYWPRWQPLAALVDVRFASAVGWVVRARSTAGDEVELYAWRAAVDRTEPMPTDGQEPHLTHR